MTSEVTVTIPPPLREFTDGESEVPAEGTTIGEILDDLEARYSGIKERICTEDGDLREFLKIHLNDEDLPEEDVFDTKVSEEDVVSITPAISGGGRTPDPEQS
jgi:molybdopterin synthase sulfur carrier subunit